MGGWVEGGWGGLFSDNGSCLLYCNSGLKQITK